MATVEYVYLMRLGLNHKIGRSKSPTRRQQQLAQAEVPEIAHLIESLSDTAPLLEKSLHLHFADKWVRGEWFLLGEADVELCRSVVKCCRREDFPGWLSMASPVHHVSYRLSDEALALISALAERHQTAATDVIEMALRRMARVDLSESRWPAAAILDAAASLLKG